MNNRWPARAYFARSSRIVRNLPRRVSTTTHQGFILIGCLAKEQIQDKEGYIHLYTWQIMEFLIELPFVSGF